MRRNSIKINIISKEEDERIRLERRSNYKFTGHKDTDYLILKLLDVESILSLAQVNRYLNKLCNKDSFWKEKFIFRFGEEPAEWKLDNKSWKQHFLEVVDDIYMENPWDFFQGIYWMMEKFPDLDTIDFVDLENENKWFNIKDKPYRHLINRFYMMPLGKSFTILYQLDRRSELNYYEAVYNSNNMDFTPQAVLYFIYEFYNTVLDQKTVTWINEETTIPYINYFTPERIDNGEVKRMNLLGGYECFHGFEYHEGHRMINLLK